MSRLDKFTLAYIEAALWSSVDDSGEPLDASYSIDDIAPDTLRKMKSDCADFQEKYDSLIEDNDPRGGWSPSELAGHDFWLTRNGHGAGFWDGDWPKHGDELTEAAKSYGEFDLIVGDDGQIHGSPLREATGVREAVGEGGWIHKSAEYSDPSAAHERAMKLRNGGASRVTITPAKGKFLVTWMERAPHAMNEAGRKGRMIKSDDGSVVAYAHPKAATSHERTQWVAVLTKTGAQSWDQHGMYGARSAIKEFANAHGTTVRVEFNGREVSKVYPDADRWAPVSGPMNEASHHVADFDSFNALLKHERERGATHMIWQKAIFYPSGRGQYTESRVWQKEGFWHAQAPDHRTSVKRLPREAVLIDDYRGLMREGSVDDPFYIVQGTYSDGTISDEFGFDDEEEAVREAKKLKHSPFFEGENVRVFTRDGEDVWDSRQQAREPGWQPGGTRILMARRGEARRYYVVDQLQHGQWEQVGHFTSRAAADKFRSKVPGRTRVVHTFPSSHNYPVLREAPRKTKPKKRSRR